MMNTLPRPEYPRPQLVRSDWQNLNGEWGFDFDFGCSGRERKVYLAEEFPMTVTVPFCPESRLSGIGHTDFIPACWYRREIEIPAAWRESGRVLLHFGAVNYAAAVYVNGQFVMTHKGGYTSFTADITRFVTEGKNVLCVGAQSDLHSGKQPSGKQSLKYDSFGCFYTRTTGIWQTVWMEHVPEIYIENLFLTPDVQNGGVHVKAVLNRPAAGAEMQLAASFDGKSVGSVCVKCDGNTASAFVKVSEIHLWECGKGDLYDLTVEIGEDRVESYFGLRTVTLENGSFCLNGKPVYMRTVLDQGFNPEGIITAPSDEQLHGDILLSMRAGFNGARLHQKIFEPRFLYWADKEGYLVWSEHGNWGLDVSNGNGLTNFLPEWVETVERDYSHPSIIGYCPFNETEPNTDPLVLSATYQVTKAIDKTRPVIDTSGWVHCGVTDIYDYHDYTQDTEQFAQNVKGYAETKEGEPFKPGVHVRFQCPTPSMGQPIFVSEYGGIGWKASETPGNSWGYGEGPKTEEEFLSRLKGLTDACLSTEGIMGFCYTQLTDVEQEINGIYTYERKEKFPTEKIRAIFSAKAWNE